VRARILRIGYRATYRIFATVRSLRIGYRAFCARCKARFYFAFYFAS
jgi:hypothetical protein